MLHRPSRAPSCRPGRPARRNPDVSDLHCQAVHGRLAERSHPRLGRHWNLPRPVREIDQPEDRRDQAEGLQGRRLRPFLQEPRPSPDQGVTRQDQERAYCIRSSSLTGPDRFRRNQRFSLALRMIPRGRRAATPKSKQLSSNLPLSQQRSGVRPVVSGDPGEAGMEAAECP